MTDDNRPHTESSSLLLRAEGRERRAASTRQQLIFFLSSTAGGTLLLAISVVRSRPMEGGGRGIRCHHPLTLPLRSNVSRAHRFRRTWPPTTCDYSRRSATTVRDARSIRLGFAFFPGSGAEYFMYLFLSQGRGVTLSFWNFSSATFFFSSSYLNSLLSPSVCIRTDTLRSHRVRLVAVVSRVSRGVPLTSDGGDLRLSLSQRLCRAR